MKISIKLAALITVILGSVSVSKAQTGGTQNGVSYSVGVETGFPTGSLHQTHTWMIGGSLQADIPVISQTYITINGGYYNITGRDNNALYAGKNAPSLRLLPAKAGIKFFPVDILYIQGEAGAAFALNRQDAGYSKSTVFIYAPTIGVKLPLSASSSLDAGVRYEGSSNFTDNVNQSQLNFFGLRVAYSFSIK